MYRVPLVFLSLFRPLISSGFFPYLISSSNVLLHLISSHLIHLTCSFPDKIRDNACSIFTHPYITAKLSVNPYFNCYNNGQMYKINSKQVPIISNQWGFDWWCFFKSWPLWTLTFISIIHNPIVFTMLISLNFGLLKTFYKTSFWKLHFHLHRSQQHPLGNPADLLQN